MAPEISPTQHQRRFLARCGECRLCGVVGEIGLPDGAHGHHVPGCGDHLLAGTPGPGE